MSKLIPSLSSAAIQRRRDLAACFGSAELMKNDSQTTVITFASDDIDLPDGRHVEFILDAEPWVSNSYGLGWRMVLEVFICEKDSCDVVLEFKVPRALVSNIASSTKPIETIFKLRPDFLSRALGTIPELELALAGRVARNERKTLLKASREVPATTRRLVL